jgi:hypothetical protein
MLIMINSSYFTIIGQNPYQIGVGDRNSDDLDQTEIDYPNNSKYASIQNNGTQLNVSSMCDGYGSISNNLISQSGQKTQNLPVPNQGIVTGMNYTLTNPQAINSYTMIINDTLAIRPNYTINYENLEFIRQNATCSIYASSNAVYPLGNISIWVNSSIQLEPQFYKNFTNGNGFHTFNVSRTTLGGIKASIKFFYLNGSFYDSKNITVNFYDVTNTTINSLKYSISYPNFIYKGQNGNISIIANNGTNIKITQVNITWDHIQWKHFTKDGVKSFLFSNDSIGIYEVSVLIYTLTNHLYANETFDIEIKESPITIIQSHDGIHDYYNISYVKNALIGNNASIRIERANNIGYLHGNVNITGSGSVINDFQNQTGIGIYYFNVSRTTSGNANLKVYFYNTTNDLNATIEFNVFFFTSFNRTLFSGINYTIIHPTTYYTGFNATSSITIHNGANSTVGDINIYHNFLRNSTYNGAGTFFNNITTKNISNQNLTVELFHSSINWMINESYMIQFLVKLENLNGTPIVKTNTVPIAGFNTSSISSVSQSRAMAIGFTLTEQVNITSFILFCNYSITSLTGNIILELRQESVSGQLKSSLIFDPIIPLKGTGWYSFNFPINLLNPGNYFFIVNGSKLNSFTIIQTYYDTFTWFFAPGSGSSHNAQNFQNEDQWRPTNKDYLMKINYNIWENSDFDHINISSSIGSIEKDMVKHSSSVAYINYTSNDGIWVPNQSSLNITAIFSTNRTCKVDISYYMYYNVSQLTETTYYSIPDTSISTPINWNFNFSGVIPETLHPSRMTTSNYRVFISIPTTWFSVNGSSHSFSEKYYLNKSIYLDGSKISEEWMFVGLSAKLDSIITIHEIEDSGSNVMARGMPITVKGTILHNHRSYYANLSIWKDSISLFDGSIVDDTESFSFPSWNIPQDATPGKYEAFYYWCNGTDVAMNLINFWVKLRANFSAFETFGEIYYNHKKSFAFNYSNYYTAEQINDGNIVSNWTTGRWSYTINPFGLYSIEFDTLGLVKGTKYDANMTISSNSYRNETLIFPIFILVNTSIELTPDQTDLNLRVNQTIKISAIYRSEFNIYGVQNNTGGLRFTAIIDSTCIPVYITANPNPDPEPYEYDIRLNLTDYKIKSQVGNHPLQLSFTYQNASSHYQTQTYLFNLKIRAQKASVTVLSTNAFDDSDLNYLVNYANDTEKMNIILNVTKQTPLNREDLFQYTNINNGTVNATLNGVKTTLLCIASGRYLFSKNISLLNQGIYTINFTLYDTDIDNASILVHLEIITKLNVVIELDDFSSYVNELSEVKLVGYVFLNNQTRLDPLPNFLINVRIEFFGIAGYKETSLEVSTTTNGMFEVLINIPSLEDYNSLVIRIVIPAGRYSNSAIKSIQSTISRPSIIPIILIIVFSVTLGIVGILLFNRYRDRVWHREMNADSLLLGRKQQKRQELKMKLKNYIRVPNLNANVDTLNSNQPQLGSDYNLIVIPPDELRQASKMKRFNRRETEEEIISKDLLLYKKEKFLAQAMESEKLGKLEDAQYYYERAAIFAEKLGAFAESLVYFKKFEDIEQKISEIYQKTDEDKGIFAHLKNQFHSQKHKDFVNDMKKQVKNMELNLFSKFDQKSRKVTTKSKEKRENKTDKKEKSGDEESIIPLKKYKAPSGSFIPKSLSMPIVSKKKLDAFNENKKLMEDIKEGFKN